VVEGEEGYKEAKEFMKMLMPSHARNVFNSTRILPPAVHPAPGGKPSWMDVHAHR
jgi:Ribonuclease G/E